MEENKEMMEVMDNNEVGLYDMEPEETSGKRFPVLAVGAIAAGIGLAVVGIKKGKGKLEELKIKSLEKKGYVVTKPVVEETSAEIVDSDEDDEK